jgi:ribosome-associated protein
MSPQSGQLGSIEVSDELVIPESEIEFRFTTGGGPGGQHVNRSATRVTLRFDVGASPSLSEAQRSKLLSALEGRIDSTGVLQLHCHDSRSQRRNRDLVVERFRDLMAEALRETEPRRPSRPSRASERKRVAEKRKRGALKRQRASKDFDDE